MSISLTDALIALDGSEYQIGEILYTPEGGRCEKYINNTGAASVKGTVVKLDPAEDNGIIVAEAEAVDFIGAMYEDGVADGEECWVVIEGDAYILLEDSTTATRGYWVGISENQAGRIDATVAAPSGGTIAQLNRHFEEMGHCRETKTAGTDVLCLVHMHFN